MNHIKFLLLSVTSILLSENLIANGQEKYASQLNKMKESFEKKQQECEKQCACYKEALEVIKNDNMTDKELLIWSKLSPSEQERLGQLAELVIHNKCNGKKEWDGWTEEDFALGRKYENACWEEDKKTAGLLEKMQHWILYDFLIKK